ncbi:MAG: ATP-binding cassette domain-containing protein [Pseudomonadales bacterium]|nr:ATP-binding cassette domain-containing protein [Pseudomonadales bacterium]
MTLSSPEQAAATQTDDLQPTEQTTAARQQPLPAAVVKLLLDRLSIAVPLGALNTACSEGAAAINDVPAAQRLAKILHGLKVQHGQTAQLQWRRFDRRRLPVMLFYQGHWHLLERIDNDQLQLINEQGQCQKLQGDELESDELAEALVLWLRPAAKAEQRSAFSFKDNIAARLVLGEVFKNRRWLGDVVIATLIINALAVCTSLFAMQVYDRVVPTLAYATLWTLVAGMAIVILLDWFLKTVRARTLDSVSCSVDKAVSQQVFDHVLQLRLDTRPRSLGTVAAQVGGLDAVRQFFTSGVIFALVDLPFALMFIAFIAVIGGAIAWVYMLMFPLALMLGWLTQRRLRRLLQQQLLRSNERQGLLVDVMQGTESIRANNAGWRFSELWQTITATINHYNIQQKAISNRATVTTASLASTAYISALVVGVGCIETGDLTMGALIACSILGGRVIAPVAQSVQYLVQWQNVAQALQMVNQLLQLERERDPQQQLLMPDSLATTLELQGLRFAYPQSPMQQLKIPHLQLNAGDRIALLGPIGCGKSTLLKVLGGLYRPSEGRVLLGHAELWELDPQLVAEQIGYLPQNVHLFKGTLHSNLCLSGAVSDSKLLEVLQDIGMDVIVANSPQGLGLEIYEGGEGLSGGQRQLVGLGRVLLAGPKIWLLDEPTASLDGESERQALQALQKHMGPEDILVLATHKPALALELANRVIIMCNGEITADGAPEVILPQLMKRPGGQVSSNAGMPIHPVNKGPDHVI